VIRPGLTSGPREKDGCKTKKISGPAGQREVQKKGKGPTKTKNTVVMRKTKQKKKTEAAQGVGKTAKKPETLERGGGR